LHGLVFVGAGTAALELDVVFPVVVVAAEPVRKVTVSTVLESVELGDMELNPDGRVVVASVTVEPNTWYVGVPAAPPGVLVPVRTVRAGSLVDIEMSSQNTGPAQRAVTHINGRSRRREIMVLKTRSKRLGKKRSAPTHGTKRISYFPGEKNEEHEVWVLEVDRPFRSLKPADLDQRLRGPL